jgi:hypothetical protein
MFPLTAEGSNSTRDIRFFDVRKLFSYSQKSVILLRLLFVPERMHGCELDVFLYQYILNGAI